MRSDEQLEFSVSRAFQAFGNVYVKIRRDNKGMPFAFCQYEVGDQCCLEGVGTDKSKHVSDSERAITLGRGLLVDGRPCRTERAKVNRKQTQYSELSLAIDLRHQQAGSLYLSKVTGGSITEDEARHVLTPYGAIEKVWYCTPTDKEMFRLPEGIWAMFAFFQDCRDAQAVSSPSHCSEMLLIMIRLSETNQTIVLSNQRCQRTFEAVSVTVLFRSLL